MRKPPMLFESLSLPEARETLK